jgi:peptide/nickel transport system ATP-binding protein
LLSVRGLVKDFRVKRALFGAFATKLRAVDRVDFEVRKGETLGVVGESGCGKSSTARLLMHLIAADQGAILFDGERVGSPALPLREYRRQVQMVFQDSYSSLNPRMTVEASIAFGPASTASDGRNRSPARATCSPASGSTPGASASATRTSSRRPAPARQHRPRARPPAAPHHPRRGGLGARQIGRGPGAEPLLDLKEEFGLTYVFISHDLNVVRFISDRVMVMYLGQVAEIGSAEEVFERPRHPYTAALLSSMPSLDPDRRTEKAPLVGDPPEPDRPPARLPLPHPLRVCGGCVCQNGAGALRRRAAARGRVPDGAAGVGAFAGARRAGGSGVRALRSDARPFLPPCGGGVGGADGGGARGRRCWRRSLSCAPHPARPSAESTLPARGREVRA